MAHVRNLRRTHVVALVVLVVGAVLATPLFANQSGWSWNDRSGFLPYRDGTSLDLLSANGGSWLASDHDRVYSINGDTVKNLTNTVHGLGLTTISTLASDDQNWIIGGRSLNSNGVQAFLTNGNTFSNVSSIFGSGDSMDATGYHGTWYGRTIKQATKYDSARWTAFSFNPTTLEKTLFPMTDGLSNMEGGCFTEGTGVKACLGETQIVRAGNNWYLIGGNAEVTNGQGATTQFAKGSIWKIDGTRLTRQNNLPSFRFVSGVWQGKNQVLVATSDVVSNPFAADHYWVFDGSTLRDVSDTALSVGLLSNDAREVRAANAGESWMITLGKNLIRFDGENMTSNDKTRDYFTTVTSNGQGVYMLGGAVSTPDQAFATQPLTAKLVEVREDMNVAVPNPTNMISRLRGPSIKVTAIPKDNVIGDGKTFTFRVTAEDADGIASTSVYVSGAKLKTCTTKTCEFTQTYYTNGQPTRTIEFMGGATDKLGYSNQSKAQTLTIDLASTISSSNDKLGQTDPTGRVMTLPNNTTWNHDTASGLAWTVWRQPTQTALKSNEQTTIVFAAQQASGLGRVNILVNGDNARTCDFTSATDIRLCTVTLSGSDYPAATDIFINAQIFNSQNTDNQAIWTDGIHVQRATSVEDGVATNQPVQAAATTRPVYTSSLTITPDVTTVSRGTTLAIKTKNENSLYGFYSIQIYQNNQVIKTCSPGPVKGVIACDVTVDTSKIPVGTSLSFVAKANDLWSNTRVVTVTDTSVQPQPLNGTSPISVWNWMAPDISEMYNWQTTYSVGAWSANGISRIEMIVDGKVARTCSFGTANGNRECTVTLSTNDFADKHSLSVNARVTDGKGNKAWSDVRTILVRRVWQDDTAGFIPAYASIQTDDATGYNVGERITFKAKGWSENSIKQTQIYLNGEMVADCPGATCQFTSSPITTDQFEYQARIIDLFGQSTWTGAIGMNKK